MVVTARSPIEWLMEFKKQRNFANLNFVSEGSGEFTRRYVGPEDADIPSFSVLLDATGRFVIFVAAR